MTTLTPSVHHGPLPHGNEAAIAQVGWLGNAGTVYALNDDPSKHGETVFSPLYIQIGTWVELEDGNWRIDD